MKKTLLALSFTGLASLTLGCAAVAQEQSPAAPAAPPASIGSHQVYLVNNDGQPAGRIQLKQGPSGLLMVIEATGLTPGWHGIHLHETAQCAANFTSAGAHINHATDKAPHGLLNPQGPDNGDLPNLYAHADGTAKAEIFTTRARIGDGQGQNLLDPDGSAIIIHASADDHISQPIGGAGARVACGIVQLMN